MKRTVVIVFHMKGCPACEAHLPRMRRVQQHFPKVDVHYLDAEAQSNAALATRLGLKATPTTYVLRQPSGSVRWEGEMSEQDIAAALQLAQRYQ